MNTQERHRHPFSVRLVGGGRDAEKIVPFFAEFVADAAARSGRSGSAPHIHALLVLEDDDEDSVERFRTLLTLAGGDAVLHAIREGDHFDPTAVHRADGLLVGGGLTPAYQKALMPIAPLVRELVATGVPYLGLSAGAAIAAEHALTGGYCVDGVPVCAEDAGEELVDVTVAAGLGLVPFSVDVHAAQWGTVSRLIAAVSAGLTQSGYAIDEHTSLHWQGPETNTSAAVSGHGTAWHITLDPQQTTGATVHRVKAQTR